MNARPQTDTRNTIDALLDTLKERLAAPGTSLVPFLTTMSRFSKYSLWNQMLIFAQRPDATRVCGYRAWNKAGYQVRKGEHGIAIYAPMLFKNRSTAADPGRHHRPPTRLPRRLRLRRLPGRRPSRHRARARHRRHRLTQRPPRQRTAESVPVRPQRRTRGQAPRAGSTRLHQRSSHHRARPASRPTSSSPRSPTRPPTCCCTFPATAARAPTSPPARPRPRRSRSSSARSSG